MLATFPSARHLADHAAPTADQEALLPALASATRSMAPSSAGYHEIDASLCECLATIAGSEPITLGDSSSAAAYAEAAEQDSGRS